MCVGYRGMWAQRERERERKVCNAFTPKTNKSWDDDHADGKSFYALVVVLEA